MHRHLTLATMAVAVFGVAASASAETFWANYSPSLETPTPFNDVWPGFMTTLDTDAEASLSAGSKFVGGTPKAPFGYTPRAVWTDFSVDADFVATHLTLPVRYDPGASDAIFGISVSKWDTSTEEWDYLAQTRVRPIHFAGSGADFIDLTVPFGMNNTNQAAFFYAEPISFEAGESYRLYMTGVSGGGRGGYHVRDSLIDGVATNTMSDYAPNDLAYQPAFAFSDGVITAVPEPASVALLGGATLLLVRKRRRRSATDIDA